MPKPENASADLKPERRKHWRDRRTCSERRNDARLKRMEADCRNNIPRRDSDLAGELDEGVLWWIGGRKFG